MSTSHFACAGHELHGREWNHCGSGHAGNHTPALSALPALSSGMLPPGPVTGQPKIQPCLKSQQWPLDFLAQQHSQFGRIGQSKSNTALILMSSCRNEEKASRALQQVSAGRSVYSVAMEPGSIYSIAHECSHAVCIYPEAQQSA